MDVSSASRLSFDVFERIMFYCLYNGNEFSPYMQDDDISGHSVDNIACQAAFIRSFSTVNREVARACSNIFWKAVVLRTAGDLSAVLDAISSSPNSSGPCYGSLCQRLELRIKGGYRVWELAELISRMPHLKVFILRNEWPSQVPPMGYRPVALVAALCSHAKELHRLQFQSVNEEPNLEQTKKLLGALPRLVTLHLDRLCVKPYPDDFSPLTQPASRLQVLSIGPPIAHSTWDDTPLRSGHLLRLFNSRHLLPSLNTLYVLEYMPCLPRFLEVFGPHIHGLGLSAQSATVPSAANSLLVDLCPRLHRVVWILPDVVSNKPLSPLPPFPNLRDLDMVYINCYPIGSAPPGRLLIEGMLSLSTSRPSLHSVQVVARPEMAHFLHSPRFITARQALERNGILVHCPVFRT